MRKPRIQWIPVASRLLHQGREEGIGRFLYTNPTPKTVSFEKSVGRDWEPFFGHEQRRLGMMKLGKPKRWYPRFIVACYIFVVICCLLLLLLLSLSLSVSLWLLLLLLLLLLVLLLLLLCVGVGVVVVVVVVAVAVVVVSHAPPLKYMACIQSLFNPDMVTARTFYLNSLRSVVEVKFCFSYTSWFPINFMSLPHTAPPPKKSRSATSHCMDIC